MVFLILHIMLISGFGLFLKDAKNRGHRMNPIGFMNYLIAFLISAWSAAQAGSFEFTRLTFAFGFTNGVAYAIGFVLVTLGMRLSGIVVTIAVVRLSLVVPILFAILFWDEIPNGWQATGILLACCALPLLGTKSPPSRAEKETGGFSLNLTPNLTTPAISSPPTVSPPSLVGKGDGGLGPGLGLLVVAMLFINSGVSRLAMKAFNEMCPIDQKPMYLLFLFGTTAIAYAGVCIYQKTVPTRWEALYGVLIGVCNVGGSWAFLKALDGVDALIAFPVSGSGGVLFTTLVGVLLLRERLERKSMIGVVATILALIFVNLK
ncbi:EamA family transporter [Candidatus Poribacteria bacterium]|nr:EamA family transporter [Candidatus Poribacteria bacterium]